MYYVKYVWNNIFIWQFLFDLLGFFVVAVFEQFSFIWTKQTGRKQEENHEESCQAQRE